MSIQQDKDNNTGNHMKENFACIFIIIAVLPTFLYSPLWGQGGGETNFEF